MKNRFRTILALVCLLCLALPVFAAEVDEKPVIIIDPGHGGADAGTTAGIREEKTYNLVISQYLRDALLDHGGFEVVLTREDDTYLKFLPRALPILEHNGDLLLSIHCNSSTVDYANGILAITSVIEPYAAHALGEDILARIAARTGMRNKGVETHLDTGDRLGVYYWNSEKNWDMPGASYLKTVSDYFSMNTWSSKFGVPSLIIEHGYLSNSGDRAVIDNDENLRAIAEAEAEALIEYYYGHTHTYTAEKVVDFPSSCSLNGTKSYHCIICGIKKDTEALPAAPDAHFYRQSASMLATCTSEGFIDYVCQISFNLNDKGMPTEVHEHRESLPLKDHAYTKFVAAAPTCTEAGSAVYTCSMCGDSYTETLAATGHRLSDNGICVVCGTNTASADAEDCAHAFAEVFRTEPGCEASGATIYRCSLCEKEEVHTLDPLGHDNIVSLDSAPSCEKDGYFRSRCLRCGKETAENRPALGHSFTAESGEEGDTRICSRCGYTESVSDGAEKQDSILTHPLFIAVVGIVLLQALLLFAMSIYRRRTNKPRQTRHTYAMEENDTDTEL